MTYKFSSRRYARRTERAFAVDEANAERFRNDGIPPDRVAVVGNLAVDGAVAEAESALGESTGEGGLLIMPGSRRHEVEQLIPFFFTAALWIKRELPSMPIAFAISPFTQLEAVRDAVERGGDRRMFAQRGRMVREGADAYLVSSHGDARFPIVRNAMAAARRAKLALTIPGTKTIELAALGTPAVACTPLNAAELIAVNGPLTYLDRLPFAGVALKRSVATAISRRYRFHTQPNMDAGRELIAELHGTLTPGRVARVVLERLADREWLAETSQMLAALYARHRGAAARMAGDLLGALRVYA